MPVEIKELHIRVAINADPGKRPTGAGAPPGGSAAAVDKDAIVAECVEQVMEILRARKER